MRCSGLLASWTKGTWCDRKTVRNLPIASCATRRFKQDLSVFFYHLPV
ncbi:hypothetical protein [Microseira wollei]|nr:hypothetical protein [Microseira wollei]